LPPGEGSADAVPDDRGGVEGRVDGDLALPAKDLEPAGVVAVLMGEDDGAEAVGLDAEGVEALAELAGGKARIDEDAGVFVAD
jgi:hypothetical protein